MSILLALLGGGSACNRQPEELYMTNISEQDAIAIAAVRAHESGVDLDEMYVEVEKVHDNFVVMFIPRRYQLGGGVTIEVSRDTGEIMRVGWGQ